MLTYQADLVLTVGRREFAFCKECKVMRLCLICTIIGTACWFKMHATSRILVVSRLHLPKITQLMRLTIVPSPRYPVNSLDHDL